MRCQQLFTMCFMLEKTLKCKVYEINILKYIHIRVVKYQYISYGEIVAFYCFFVIKKQQKEQPACRRRIKAMSALYDNKVRHRLDQIVVHLRSDWPKNLRERL